jgi:hypothetical protein
VSRRAPNIDQGPHKQGSAQQQLPRDVSEPLRLSHSSAARAALGGGGAHAALSAAPLEPWARIAGSDAICCHHPGPVACCKWGLAQQGSIVNQTFVGLPSVWVRARKERCWRHLPLPPRSRLLFSHSRFPPHHRPRLASRPIAQVQLPHPPCSLTRRHLPVHAAFLVFLSRVGRLRQPLHTSQPSARLRAPHGREPAHLDPTTRRSCLRPRRRRINCPVAAHFTSTILVPRTHRLHRRPAPWPAISSPRQQ